VKIELALYVLTKVQPRVGEVQDPEAPGVANVSLL